MIIKLKKPLLQKILEQKNIFTEGSKEEFYFRKLLGEVNEYGYRSKNEADFEIFKISDKVIQNLWKFAKDEQEKKKKDKNYELIDGINTLSQMIGVFYQITKDDKTKIKDCKKFATILEYYLKNKTKGRLIFSKDMNGKNVPYIITKIKYNKSYIEDGHRIQPSVDVKLEWVDQDFVNQDKNLYFYLRDIDGGTLQQIFLREGYVLETEEMYEEFLEQRKRFIELQNKVGLQIWGEGYAKTYSTKERTSGWHYSWRDSTEYINLTVEGQPSILIVDNPEEEERTKKLENKNFRSSWSEDLGFGEEDYKKVKTTKKKRKDEDEDEDDEDESSKSEEAEDFDIDKIFKIEKIIIPQHPYVISFNKQTHAHCQVHIDMVKEYVYDKNLKNKLIIEDEHADLLDLLISHEGDLMDDIIKGKSSGIIVMLTGDPGVGKTLTAEVSSESVGKPLYEVQASQLGINVQDLEKNLYIILQRATRWKAILVINECDVYVRTRGEDIEQNAIVGVFLRLLEYYKGILFLTSNSMVEKFDHEGKKVKSVLSIDDAIMSRCVAHLRYKIPTGDKAKKIWKQFLALQSITYAMKDVDSIVEEYALSGRDIKNVCKLCKLYVQKKGAKFNKDLVDRILKFQHISGKKISETA
jgi:hypothetical protein